VSCEFAEHDGAYVLGALAPAERLEFEEHLAQCPQCAQSVRELAGLPGLLARVDPAVLEQAPVDVPVPETLLPSLTRTVRRTRRRRLLATSGLAAAAAAAAVALVPIAVNLDGGAGGTPSAAGRPGVSAAPASPPAEAMLPVGNVPVRARLSLASVAWGTRLDLSCTYGATEEHERYHLPRTVTYRLFVRNREGAVEQVGTWRSVRGRTMQLTAATAEPRKDIASVEVRTADGKPVLELTT
jgi:hypothetical protein